MARSYTVRLVNIDGDYIHEHEAYDLGTVADDATALARARAIFASTVALLECVEDDDADTIRRVADDVLRGGK